MGKKRVLGLTLIVLASSWVGTLQVSASDRHPIRSEDPDTESFSIEENALWSAPVEESNFKPASSQSRPSDHQVEWAVVPATPSPATPQDSSWQLPEDAALKVGQPEPDASSTDLPMSTLHRHEMDGSEVVTVYLKDLPIVSFMDHPQAEDPLARASRLVSRLNLLSGSLSTDDDITLDRAETASRYKVSLNEDPLLIVDEGILAMNTQQTQAQVALLAANRLRRLLLSAPPIVPSPSLDTESSESKTLPLKDPAIQADSSINPSVNLTDTRPTMVAAQTITEKGYASWYHPHAWNKGLTAAHPTLPFGTKVEVTNLATGEQAVVEINERGPFLPGRIIDVSYGAARALNMLRAGVIPVRIKVLAP